MGSFILLSQAHPFLVIFSRRNKVLIRSSESLISSNILLSLAHTSPVIFIALLDELTIEANEESFVIVLQHGSN